MFRINSERFDFVRVWGVYFGCNDCGHFFGNSQENPNDYIDVRQMQNVGI
jgi:hypothetical protein